ncbi:MULTISPECIES: hypothetical protein [Pseudomonas syringae group]|uniref:Uncharacterized protein n=2 Tax=Pseudomonas syringae group TaxID=136849 RepID=A0A0P9Q226_PSESX|nr:MULTISPECIES: hypothetical protein [Pseudomonas syringae group]KPW91607.1 Uncharacterized protein ALO50_02873 [Pseudomonas syringae pv. cerasicola]PHN69947.1 hypothetical protein AO252_16395 [Pseudomonas syringae pv. cerasicola]RMS71128.1 hypothetical protein ALP61_02042 [Pseudomonas savastanoi]RMS78836.1 hypothetical protein ALP60_02823 [Pseudomonas savastanoi]SOS16504.1 putative secreted protein [Pseudomonas syringae pv. cerasicola]
MNRIIKISMLKGFVVTTFAVISLQGVAFAAASKPSSPVTDGDYALVQDAGKNISKNSKATPMQVARRIPQSTNRNPCDVNPFTCV